MNSHDVLQRPVIVIGAPRSGTSILGRLLSQSPGTAYANEPRLIWRYGNDRRSDILPASSITPAIREHIRRKFKQFLEREQSRRLVEKYPGNALRMEFVDEIFPDAIYVHVIRNGYDSVDSIERHWGTHTAGVAHRRVDSNSSILVERLREAHWSQVPYYALELFQRLSPLRKSGTRQLWGPRLPGLEQWVRDMTLKEVAALQWRFCVELACRAGRQMPEGKYKEIRLEDIDRDVMHSVYAFCDLEWTEACETYFNTEFSAEASGKMARAVSASEKDEKVRALIQPTIDYYLASGSQP